MAPHHATQQRTRNQDTLTRYFQLLSALDIDAWIQLWAENCTVLTPFAPRAPHRIDGREALHAFYAAQAATYTQLAYPGTEIHPLQDPTKLLARWYPKGELAAGGSYANENVGLFEFDQQGRIRHFTEYFNPLPVTQDAA
jgi:ketosteroid isomerase-like protein